MIDEEDLREIQSAIGAELQPVVDALREIVAAIDRQTERLAEEIGGITGP